jgi:two-component system chemotaxis response regulator CheB
MKSVSPVPKLNVIGVILTGMGADGARGIRHIKKLGAITLAQDEASSTVFGMPKAAIDTGMVDFVLPPEEIADKIVHTIGLFKSLTDECHRIENGPIPFPGHKQSHPL